ncbi:MAG: tetratricopeptide repeat protein, partial [Chitinophagales bacterium]
MKKQQQLLWLTIAIISTAMMSGNKTAYAQKIPLHGVVSIQNSGFNNKGVIEYVNLAQVEDDFDSANPDATDSEGKFTLNYIGVAQNDAVSFSVKKAGLKVVNIDRLNVTLGKNEATQIYMCEPEVLAENKKRYYKIGKTAGEKQLKIKLQQAKEELALLERAVDVNVIQIQDKNEQIRFLEQQGQNLDKHAKELAKRFAHENFDEASALSQKAFRLFQEGKIYEALDVLDIKRLDADLKKADEAIAKGEDLIRAGTKMKATGEKGKQLIVKDCMLGAEMAQAVFEFEKAEAYFEKAIQADSTNLSNLWKYAFYLAKQNKFNKAEQLYEKCLDLAKTPYERATFLNNLGALLATKNELEKAEQAYEEALSIYRKLAAKNPDAYLFYVATPLNNLGALLADKNELEKAEQAYEEALSIYRKLAEKNPAAYLPYVATSLNNLGALLADKNELEKAEQAYEEALSIRRKLAEKNPDAYLPYVATSLNNLGILYQAKNELEKAEQAYEETLSIYRKLAEKNP